MKKTLLILTCLMAWNICPTVAAKSKICLGCQKIDNDPIGPGHSKSPMRIPDIYLDNYTLDLPSIHRQYIINLIQDGEVIYSSIIPEGMTEFELPGYLCGDYVIQFIQETYCFIGYIIL